MNGHTTALPNPRTPAQAIAATIYDTTKGSLEHLQIFVVWHLAARSNLAISHGIAHRFLQAVEAYAPPAYQRYVRFMTAEERDEFDCQIAAEVFRLVNQ